METEFYKESLLKNPNMKPIVINHDRYYEVTFTGGGFSCVKGDALAKRLETTAEIQREYPYSWMRLPGLIRSFEIAPLPVGYLD